MLAVLHLNPMLLPATAIRPVSIAGRPKQFRANLALFEWGDEDALGATGQEPGLLHPSDPIPAKRASAQPVERFNELAILVPIWLASSAAAFS